MGLITKHYCKLKNNSLEFYLPSGKFTIESDVSAFVDVLDLCDGSLEYDEIIQNTVSEKEISIQVLDHLIANKIVVKIKDWIKYDYDLTMFPDIKPVKEYENNNSYILKPHIENTKSINGEARLTNIADIISVRKSTRDYINEPINTCSLNEILKCVSKHSVPSPGGYAVYEVLVCVHRDDTDISKGWHWYNQKNQTLDKLKTPYSEQSLKRIHEDEFILHNVTYSVYLVAQLESHFQKYGNRGLKFVFAEGGSLLQNAYLCAAEMGIGIVALGGFDEKFLLQYLNFETPWIVPFSFVLGKSSNDKAYSKKNNQLKENIDLLKKSLISEGYIKNTQIQKWDENNNPLVSCSTEFVIEGYSDFGFGTANTTALSLLKSLVETHERVASSQPHFTVNTRADKLDSYIDPNMVYKRSIDYVNKYSLYKFSTSDINLWLEGHDYLEEKSTMTLVDTVFYPVSKNYLGREPFIYGNSSGVGAHFEPHLAKQSALFEILERDALMVTWFSKRPVLRLDYRSLESSICSLIEKHNKLGVEVIILDISIHIPTFLVVFINKSSQPHFTSGASSNLNSDQALKKAFQEAEFNYLSWREYGQFKAVNKDDIVQPTDHHMFYCDLSRLDSLRWLTDSQITTYTHKECEIETLLDEYNPWFFQIKSKLAPSLYVYRCLCDNLAKISFGSELQFLPDQRMKSLGMKINASQLKTPHFFS